MKRISRRNFIKIVGAGAAALGLAACGGSTSSSTAASGAASSGAAASTESIKVAAIETAYGSEMWQKVADAFTEQTGIAVELTTDKNLEDVIGPSMQGGDYPDVIHLATGREAALTEQFIKGNLIADITDVLSMTVPGETAKVSDKIAGGFTDTSLTNPYNDGKTYLAPMFYSPCGLFYNAGFLAENGWEVPQTWDEMWTLGDAALAAGTYLFTYPTTGYFDAFFYALMYAAGGPEFFDKATHYEEGIWDTPEAQTCFDIVTKLATYTNPITPAQANDQDFTQNQQLVLDNKALFPRAATATATPGLSRPGFPPALSTSTPPSSLWPSCTATWPASCSLSRAPSSPSWASPTPWRATTSCSTPSTTTAPRQPWATLLPSLPFPASRSAPSSLIPSTPWSRAPSPSRIGSTASSRPATRCGPT